MSPEELFIAADAETLQQKKWKKDRSKKAAQKYPGKETQLIKI
jgi:hypothetical protein